MNLQVSTVLIIVRKIKYFLLLVLGYYFISQGGVIQKFQVKRTAFSEYSESISDMPTIVTRISYSANKTWSYGKDFSIAVKPRQSAAANNSLKYGRNEIDGLSLRFEHLRVISFGPGKLNEYRITPLNFPPMNGLSDYEIKWTLNDTSGHSSKVNFVGMVLTTHNNSMPCVNSNLRCSTGYNDGEIRFINIKLSEKGFFKVFPEKIIYLKELGTCRSQPYNIEVLRVSMERISTECRNPCRPNITFIEPLDQIVGHLPLCSSEEDLTCYDRMISYSGNRIQKKPCTKLQYRVRGAVYPGFSKSNQAKFILRFTWSVGVGVKEEYFIYDFVAMISAIGGTLGLCIGFSFDEFINFILTCLEGGVNWVKSKKTKNQLKVLDIKPLNHDFKSHGMPSPSESSYPSQDIANRLLALEKSVNKILKATEINLKNEQ